MLAGVKLGLTALLALAALAGCSGGGGEADPPPAKGAPKAVAAAIDRLERAAQRRDFAGICRDLLAADARERAGGGDCAQLLRSTAGDVRQPQIRVLSIEIEGDRADVRVISRAEGQSPVQETIQLVREGDEYRIAALEG